MAATTNSILHCTALTLDGMKVFVELTARQMMCTHDPWSDERIDVVEDLPETGTLRIHSVRLADLTEIELEILRENV